MNLLENIYKWMLACVSRPSTNFTQNNQPIPETIITIENEPNPKYLLTPEMLQSGILHLKSSQN